MEQARLSRRDFLRGAGLTGAAAAGMLAFPGAGKAFADDGAADAQSTEATDSGNEYSKALGDDASLCPLRKADFPGPRGPIAFEDRDIAESEISSTEECEVLIIGAGIGGLMGSLKAAEEGAKVITLEKMTEGRSAWESFGAVGAKFQKEQGIDIDPAQLRDEIYRAADWRVDPCSIETYVNRSGEVADFWQDMLDKGGSGWQLYKFDQAPNYNGFPVIDSYVNFKMPEGVSTTWLFGLYVCKELRAVAETYDNLEIRYEMPAVQLIREDGGRVIGCIAKNGDGYVRINASKGVLLATGGYDANPEMMQAWVRPEDYESSVCGIPAGDHRRRPHGMASYRRGHGLIAAPVMNFATHPVHVRREARVLPRRYELLEHRHRRGQALCEREPSAPVHVRTPSTCRSAAAISVSISSTRL